MVNLKLRLKNKATLAAIIAAVVSAAYQILAALGITPSVDQSAILTAANLVLTILCVLGIIVDPTTPGVADSDRAMGYDIPGTNLDELNKDRDDQRDAEDKGLTNTTETAEKTEEKEG